MKKFNWYRWFTCTCIGVGVFCVTGPITLMGVVVAILVCGAALAAVEQQLM